MIITKKDPILQQLLPKGLTGHKPFIDGKDFQILQKTYIIILQIIHVLIMNIL